MPLKPRVVAALLVVASAMAVGAHARPRPSALIDRARALARDGRAAAIAPLSATDRFATFEAVDRLLREGAPADLPVARALAQGYRLAFGDQSLTVRVATIENWSDQDRSRWSEALRVKDGARRAFAEGHLDQAQAAYAEALEVFRALGDANEEARCLTSLGGVVATRGESRAALEQLDAARPVARRAGDENLLGVIELNRSFALADLARFDEALAALDAAEAVAQRTADPEVELRVAINRGTVLENLGRLPEAADALRATAVAAVRAGDLEAEANAWFNLGVLAQTSGAVNQQRECWARALTRAERAGLRPLEAQTHVALARLARKRARWEEDRSHLDAARRVLTGIDDPQRLADLELNEALHRIAQSRFAEALPFLDAARKRIDGLDARALSSAVEGARSVAFYYAGEYALAEATMRRALVEAQSAGLLDSEAEHRAGLGFVLFHLGQAAEGLAELETASRIHESLGNVARRAYDLNLLGVLRFRAGDLTGAHAALEQAVLGFDRENEPTSHAEALKDLGVLELALGGEFRAAGRRRLRDARGIVSSIGDPLGLLHISLLEAEAAIDARELAEARGCLTRAAGAAARTSTREFAWKLLYVRGRLAEADSDRASAARSYRRAIQEVEHLRAGTPRAIGRAAILDDRLAPYRALAGLLLEQGAVADAWQVARAGKARGFLEGRAPFPIDAAFGEVTESLPALASGTNATWATEPVASERLRALLRVGEVLLDFYLDGETLLVYVARRERLSIRRLRFGANSAGLLAVARWPGRPLEEDGPVTTAWRRAVRELGAALFAPLASDLAGAQSLLLVPHGLLHEIPWGALESDGRRLFERFDLALLPAADALGSRARRARGTGFLAFGDPANVPAEVRLPAAAAEARALAARIPGGRALVGDEATEANFLKFAPAADGIHVAAHGRVDRAAPRRSCLLLGRGTQADGRLEAGEIAELRLSASLVVLSGCGTAVETGLARGDAPADDRFGLPRAFLEAGAGSVIAGLWEMEDSAARTLMPQLYTHPQRDAAAAVAALQRRITAPNGTPELRRLDHPYYWAGLAAYGAGFAEPERVRPLRAQR